jgi:hypothetical protein
MSSSIVSVITPATNRDCTTVQVAKDELGLTDSTWDGRLRRWIRDASAAIVAYIGRELAREEVSEAIYHASRGGGFLLSRFPVVSVASVSIGTSTYDTSDYTLDADSGRLMLAALQPDCGVDRYLPRWFEREPPRLYTPLTVQYTGGYLLPDNVPPAIEEAALIILAQRKSSYGRDPAVTSESIGGVISRSYAITTPSDIAPIPAEAAMKLDPYREWRF